MTHCCCCRQNLQPVLEPIVNILRHACWSFVTVQRYIHAIMQHGVSSCNSPPSTGDAHPGSGSSAPHLSSVPLHAALSSAASSTLPSEHQMPSSSGPSSNHSTPLKLVPLPHGDQSPTVKLFILLKNQVRFDGLIAPLNPV